MLDFENLYVEASVDDEELISQSFDLNGDIEYDDLPQIGEEHIQNVLWDELAIEDVAHVDHGRWSFCIIDEEFNVVGGGIIQAS